MLARCPGMTEGWIALLRTARGCSKLGPIGRLLPQPSCWRSGIIVATLPLARLRRASGAIYPRGLIDPLGNCPCRVRGPGHMVPTYFRRELRDRALQRPLRLRTLTFFLFAVSFLVFASYDRHTPPPGLASGEPDNRLQRSIQYVAASQFDQQQPAEYRTASRRG